MIQITIDTETASQRLDKFLRRYLPEAGSGFLYKQLRKKNITLNGAKASGKELLREGDEVRIVNFPQQDLSRRRTNPESPGLPHLPHRTSSLRTLTC